VASDFPSIRPADDDDLTMDFSSRVGSSTIASAAWSCAVSPHSTETDPDPAARLVGSPTHDNTSTTQHFGGGVNGVTYRLTVTVTLANGYHVSDSADLDCVLDPAPVEPVLTVEAFRRTFPAFADVSVYPEEQVRFWVDIATVGGVIDPQRWGQFYDIGLRLYVAHNLALERMAARQTSRGFAPVGTGIISSRSVGPVSVSYDVEFGSEADGGHWNLTSYGSRFLSLLRTAGAAPIQLI
jgi:hypothetical protein